MSIKRERKQMETEPYAFTYRGWNVTITPGVGWRADTATLTMSGSALTAKQAEDDAYRAVERAVPPKYDE